VPVDEDRALGELDGLNFATANPPHRELRNRGAALTIARWSIVLAAQNRLQVRHLAKLLSLWQLPSLISCHNCTVSLILVAL
jgi:hypothetical protein